jgi:hypothetical protein
MTCKSPESTLKHVIEECRRTLERWIGRATNLNWLAAVFFVLIPIKPREATPASRPVSGQGRDADPSTSGSPRLARAYKDCEYLPATFQL